MKMKKVLSLLLFGLVVASAGCISFNKGGIILDLGNQTYTIPLNQTNVTSTNVTSTTYTWEQNVAMNKTVIINASGEIWKIYVDYDFVEQKFGFFVTDPANSTNLYYEPVNMTIAGDIKFTGGKYFTGTNVYLAHIKLESKKPFEVRVE